MKHRTINVLLLILSALGCDSKSKLTPELLVIKNLYNIPCYEFSMDTLKSFDRLFNFAKLQFHEYGDSCLYVGFVLNLSDSSFTPSPDKSMNCVIPCGQAGPLILKWVPINDFYVKDLEND
jgi:hypothetical protein